MNFTVSTTYLKINGEDGWMGTIPPTKGLAKQISSPAFQRFQAPLDQTLLTLHG